jgi:hypothetical protein
VDLFRTNLSLVGQGRVHHLELLILSNTCRSLIFPTFSHQVIKKDEFYALLSVADLALITPLRDGMNTTCMEYVIAQAKTHQSPIILSEFMGISPSLRDALQVNPWDLGVSNLFFILP